jgi:hypothetical protein
MKTFLPILWFISAALMILVSIFTPMMMGLGAESVTGLGMLASTLPQGVLSATAAVAFGLTHMLIARTRPSTAATLLGYMHLIAAVSGRGFQVAADAVRQQIVLGIAEVSEVSQSMAYMYMGAGLVTLLALILFIIAVAVALNTRPPAEDVF